MDLATLIGLVFSFGVIAAAMVMGGSAGAFFNVPSIILRSSNLPSRTWET